jgi:phenylalanyl-tRNA synthetase beta chain
LRPSLVAGMAGMLARNLARDVSTVRLFELGTVFTGSTAEVQERPGLAMGATGGATATALYRPDEALLFEVKGALEALLSRFAGKVRFESSGLPPWVAPGRGARVLLQGEAIGVFGELSAAEMTARKLRQNCVLAEVRSVGSGLRTCSGYSRWRSSATPGARPSRRAAIRC